MSKNISVKHRHRIIAPAVVLTVGVVSAAVLLGIKCPVAAVWVAICTMIASLVMLAFCVARMGDIDTDPAFQPQEKNELCPGQRMSLALQSTDNAVFVYDYQRKCFVDFTNSTKLIQKTKDDINYDLAYIMDMEPSQAVVEMCGYLHSETDLPLVDTAMNELLTSDESSYVARLTTASGGSVWCNINVSVTRDKDGNVSHILGFLGNIDAIKRQADVFKRKSEKDALTGFYNKTATISIIDRLLAEDRDGSCVMFALDIDNFKGVNDTLGHIAGDAVLAESTERIRSIFRSTDVLGRVGGDEFVVFITGVSDESQIIEKANKIVEAFHIMSMNVGGVIDFSVSIGIVRSDGVPSCYKELFAKADKALYYAKRHGKNRYAFYETGKE